MSVVSFKESEELIRIGCEIYVGHDSQKGIIIGHKAGCCHARPAAGCEPGVASVRITSDEMSIRRARLVT